MIRAIVRGAAAGAAGTAALNAATYLDMALRGRPASDTPERTVDAIAQRAGVAVPGEDGARDNRLTGLGALSGIAAGVGVGAMLAVARSYGLRPGPVVGSVLAGLAAMAASDVPMAGLGVADPRSWSAPAWLSDLVPHLTYGAVTTAMLEALGDDPA